MWGQLDDSHSGKRVYFQQLLLKFSVSHDLSETILICCIYLSIFLYLLFFFVFFTDYSEEKTPLTPGRGKIIIADNIIK